MIKFTFLSFTIEVILAEPLQNVAYLLFMKDLVLRKNTDVIYIDHNKLVQTVPKKCH